MPGIRTQALVVAMILTCLLIPATPGDAVGYVEQRQVTISLFGPARVVCGQKAIIRAKVRSLRSGRPVANQAVRWRFSLKRSSRDRLSAYRTITNRRGLTLVKVSFGPRSGKRVVRARIPGMNPRITVRCRRV